jgi:hypothetical protein
MFTEVMLAEFLALLRDPIVFPVLMSCMLAVVMLPWWSVLIGTAAVVVAEELVHHHHHVVGIPHGHAVYGFHHIAVLGFDIDGAMPHRLLATVFFLSALHLCAVVSANRRAPRLRGSDAVERTDAI